MRRGGNGESIRRIWRVTSKLQPYHISSHTHFSDHLHLVMFADVLYRDNTELPKYIAQVLGMNLDETTKKLRAVPKGWIPPESANKKRSVEIGRGYEHDH